MFSCCDLFQIYFHCFCSSPLRYRYQHGTGVVGHPCPPPPDPDPGPSEKENDLMRAVVVKRLLTTRRLSWLCRCFVASTPFTNVHTSWNPFGVEEEIIIQYVRLRLIECCSGRRGFHVLAMGPDSLQNPPTYSLGGLWKPSIIASVSLGCVVPPNNKI